MSKTLSLKLDEATFADAEKIVHAQHISRNAYINAAIRYYNSLNQRKELKKQLAQESLLVREESMHIYRVFEEADPLDEA